MASTFWKGALGSPRQKCFWIGFSIVVAIVAIIVMAALMPPLVWKEENLRAGEWIHIYPDSFWHDSADYSFTTVPKDGSKGKKFSEGRAFVYNIKKYGKRFLYDMNTDNPLDKYFLLGDDNWTTDIYMTTGSSFSITLTPRYSVPIDFIATTSELDLEEWVKTGNTSLSTDILQHIDHSENGLSTVVELKHSDGRFVYGKRVYLGLMASRDTTRKSDVLAMTYSRYIKMAPQVNCSNYTNGKASFPVGSLSLLQINAPDACTDENIKACTVEVWLQPRWIIYIILVVIPTIIVGIGLVIGLIALRALQVREMIAYMRKKAAEEGVALEEGKSKDIHAEKVEANADEGEKDVQHVEDDEEADEPKDDEEKPKESSDAAVLTTAAADDEQ